MSMTDDLFTTEFSQNKNGMKSSQTKLLDNWNNIYESLKQLGDEIGPGSETVI